MIGFVIFDVLVFLLVLKRVVKVNVSVTGNVIRLGQGAVTTEQLHMLGQFAREQHPKIGEYMRANWSGVGEQLPGVVSALLDQLDRDAKAQGLALDRQMLKSMLASSLRSHRIGKGHELGDALKQVA
jgi:hypothetical protein